MDTLNNGQSNEQMFSVKMSFLCTSLTAIGFCLASIAGQCFGDLVVLRHSPTNNGLTRRLTCVSGDDDAALIWNHNCKINASKSSDNIFTDFEPKKPASKNITECAIWNSTLCIAKWEKINGWDAVNSAIRPMGPVYDYRWEGFREFVPEGNIHEQEYQYVGKVKESSSTAVFSVRAFQDVYIFLCENENPQNGPCFWIIIGGSRGKRSEIRTCVNGAPDPRQFTTDANCLDVANVEREATDTLNGYEWRTFRLEWSGEKKTIGIFKDTKGEPFLRGFFDQWHPVSHISIRSELRTRVRFHFYEYLLTRIKNAVLSTTEFIQYDEKFCLDLLIGLCPKCKLNVNLVDIDGGDTPIKNISGVKNSQHEKLLTWRSIRLNVTLLLPNFNPRIVKLKLVTVQLEDGVESQWTIGSLHTCRSVGGLRESTVTTHRDMLALATRLWPVVKCQKISYGEKTIVDSISKNHYRGTNQKPLLRGALMGRNSAVNIRRGFETGAPNEAKKVIITPMKEPPHSEYELSTLRNAVGLLPSRKVRDVDKCEISSTETTFELYEGDNEKNTISLRYGPVKNNHSVYFVSYFSKTHQWVNESCIEFSKQKNECKLWEDYVCFEGLLLPNNDKTDIAVKLSGRQNCELGRIETLLDFNNQDSSKPSYLNWTFLSDGIVRLHWPHPKFPYTKIKQFNIFVEYLKTRLLNVHPVEFPITVERVDKSEKKEYTREISLLTSTEYRISISAVNQRNHNGTKVEEQFFVPSGVAFASQLQVTHNGTLIEITVPAAVNATDDTYIVISVKGLLKCARKLPSTSPSPSLTNYTDPASDWVVDEYQVNSSTPKTLRIGANETYNSTCDCFLQFGETYEIEVKVTDRHSPETPCILTSERITLTNGEPPSSVDSQNPVWFIVLPIIAIFLLALVIWQWKRRKVALRTSQQESLHIADTEHSSADRSLERLTSSSDADETKIRVSIQPFTPDAVSCDPHSHSVRVENFEEYVKKALAIGLLDSQYKMFLRDLTRPYDYGILPENSAKNRYKNLIAYDHNRVVLEKLPGDPHSDYINASYIRGHRKERAYIATQGPKPNTVRDFWRMIWQEKVRVICMLANVTEGGKRKCEQYWPEVGSRLKYGVILVSNTGHEVFADYTFRTFMLGCQKEKREVKHFHYTGWPDHGVPMYTQSLVSYLKKLQDAHIGDGPVVVHCSAGVGRTGTIILSDICLQQAAEEKKIDVPAAMVRMREDRANLVDSAQQYLLAHLTIVENMVFSQTQIACTNVLPATITELRKQLPSDLRRLNDTVWQDRALHAIAAPRRPTPMELMKNGIPELIPGDLSATNSEQYPTFESEESYTNAMSVDGVKMKKQYVASRLPSIYTVSEFWKLVAKQRIELIVILQHPDPNDPLTFRDILPDDSVLEPVPYVQVEAKSSVVVEEHFSSRKLWLTDTSEEEARLQPVTVLSCSGWGCGKNDKPPKPTALVSLWRASEKISRKEGPTLVVCRDSVTGCGLYLALSFLLERMAVERECDVISAVRAVRRTKPEFVESLEQFEYLYDAAVDYIKCFETYANFS